MVLRRSSSLRANFHGEQIAHALDFTHWAAREAGGARHGLREPLRSRRSSSLLRVGRPERRLAEAERGELGGA